MGLVLSFDVILSGLIKNLIVFRSFLDRMAVINIQVCLSGTFYEISSSLSVGGFSNALMKRISQSNFFISSSY